MGIPFSFKKSQPVWYKLLFIRVAILFTINLFSLYVGGGWTESNAQCTPTSFLSANISTNQSTGCEPLKVSFDATIAQTVTAETLVEKFDVTFKSPYQHSTSTLACGQRYLLRISGTYSVWINIPDVLDAAYRYFAPTGQFGNNVSSPYNFRPNNDTPNTTNHTYDYCIIGRGCPLEVRFNDSEYPNRAQFPDNNWALYPFPDNSGTLHYELYKEPTTYNYSWNFGDTASGTLNTSSLKNPEHIFTTSGTYTVQLNIVNSSCTKDTSTCSYSVTTTIKVSTVNAIIEGTTTFCAGESTTLTASGGTNYLWNTGDTTAAITQHPPTDTTYSVIISEGACSDTATVAITVNPLPTANAGNDITICPNNSIQLNATGGTSYQWSSSPDLSNDTIFNPTVKPNSTTSFIVKVTNANACISYDTIRVTVDTSHLVPQFTPKDLTGDTPLTVNFNNTTIGGSSYLWRFEDEITSDKINPSHIYTSAGSYSVMLIAYNANDCADTTYGNIQVQDNESELWLPNSFSPDEDGMNDFFAVKSIGIITFSAMIFDRWGELIYEWENIDQGWDGKYKNTDAPTGVYVYVIKAKGIDNKMYQKSGHLTLLR